MKTAISIPDDVFRAADAAARAGGMSRSQLFVEAVKLFLQRRGDRGITEQLDEVYAKSSSQVDSVLSRMQIAATVARDEW